MVSSLMIDVCTLWRWTTTRNSNTQDSAFGARGLWQPPLFGPNLLCELRLQTIPAGLLLTAWPAAPSACARLFRRCFTSTETIGTGSPGWPPHRSRALCAPCRHRPIYVSLFCRWLLIVQELCESRGGRPGLSVLTSLLVSVDVKIYWTVLRHWSQLVPNMSHDIWGH